MKILVADDEPTSLLIVRTALRALGHECLTVTDGAQAWDAVRAQHPDVVICDWVMPGLSGVQLCRRIRMTSTGDGYTYVIMVTGRGERDEIVEGMQAGADDYLTKPLDTGELEACLIAAARITSTQRQLVRQRVALEGRNDELSAVALRDPLTGLGNRRALEEDLKLLEERVSRYGQRYCLALIDVDHFKSYNDTYGHQAGDEVLQAVAAQLRDASRGGDGLYRYGGEEFLCVFPEQTLASAAVAADRMRSGLEGLAIAHTGNPHGVLTLSAGIAMLEPGQRRSVAEVLKDADDALYRAKTLGRNHVEYAQPRAA